MERSFIESEALEQACGILACRLEIDREAARQILDRVSRREGVSRAELVANVIASCAGSTVIPADMYANGYGMSLPPESRQEASLEADLLDGARS